MRNRMPPRHLSLVLLLLPLASLPSFALSQTITWAAPVSGNWEDVSKWSPAVVPDGIGTTVVFSDPTPGISGVGINAPHTISRLEFGGVHRFSLTSGASPGELVFAGAGGPAEIDYSLSASSNVAVPLTLSTDLIVLQSRASSSESLAFTRPVSGPGALIKDGPGILFLTSDLNSFSGGTRIAAGTLAGSANSIPGDVENDGILEFLQVSDGTFAGDISGTGTVVKSQDGKLVLTGSNTYSGGTSVGRGTLEGSATSLQGDILVASAGVLGFAQGSDGTYSGVLSGPGAVTKTGAGVLALTGTSTLTGTTTVQEGGLRVDGSLPGAVDVLTGARLSGSGTAGTVTIADGAFIAPGNSIGTLSLGSLDISGTYEVEYRAPSAGAPLVASGTGQSLRGRNTVLDPGLAPADQDADLIVVSGAALIAPTSRVVLQPLGATDTFEAAFAAPGNTNRELRYQILRGDSGVTGTFVALSESGSTLEYLDAGGGAQDVWLVLRGADVPVLVGAAPAPYVLPRAADRPRCDTGIVAGAWCGIVQGTYSNLSVDQDGSLPGTDADGASGLVGVGYGVADGLRVGVALLTARGDLALSADGGRADTNRTGGLVWAEWQTGHYDLRGWLGYRATDIDSRRTTSTGAVARADYASDETTLALEARRWSEIRPGLALTPLIGFSGSWVSQDSYTETGGGVENFSAEDQSRDSFQSLLGVEMRWQPEAPQPVELTASLGWLHEFGDTTSSLSGTYQGDATGTRFVSESPSVARNSLAAGIGATLTLNERNALRFDYGLAYNGDSLDQGAGVRWSMQF